MLNVSYKISFVLTNNSLQLWACQINVNTSGKCLRRLFMAPVKEISIAMLHNSITKKATTSNPLPQSIGSAHKGETAWWWCMQISFSSHNLRDAPDHVSNCTDITTQVNNKYPIYLDSLDTNNYTWALCCCTLLLIENLFFSSSFLMFRYGFQ
jgi:hypothetical protein